MARNSAAWPTGKANGGRKAGRLWALALLFAVFAAACASEAPPEAMVVARVNGKPITLAQFNARAAFMGLGADPGVLGSELRKSVLTELINRRLVLDEAARQGIELEPDEVANRELVLRGQLDEKTFERTLAMQGIAYQQWRGELAKQILLQKTLEMVTLSGSGVSAADIKRYYREHPDEFSRPEQILAQHALLPSRVMAQKLVDQVAAGKDLAAAADAMGSPLPDGGRPAWLSRGHMPPALEKRVFALKPGQLAGPLPSPYGFHVVRVVDKRPASELSLGQAAGKIQRLLKARRKEKAAGEWLADLRQQAEIDYSENFIAHGSPVISRSR